MSKKPISGTFETLDANEAAAKVAYRLSEVVAIYPITPSSPMAEHCDDWSSKGLPNLWETVPAVIEMQSEGGAAGALHGALQGGSLATTFTASQGLLLMVPNMYKIAGELTPMVMHVTARSLATSSLSIFGDHSDVMACRQTGFAMLASNSVQEAADMAAIAHAATLRCRVPFMHFFDGFRTSHEVNTAAAISNHVLEKLMDPAALSAFRSRAMSPDAPSIRGTAANPDVYFQIRESVNPFYIETPGVVQSIMDEFAELTGRHYKLFDYYGAEDAEEVLVLMGSGAETAAETAKALNRNGRKTGVLAVRLFRPWDLEAFAAALPQTAKSIAVLDRTKEPGSVGEPLYQDVVTALADARADGLLPETFQPRLIAGRYGLGSKEFTPEMVVACFDELAKEKPRRRFTVGINDDVTGLSLKLGEAFNIQDSDTFEAVFFGLGSDGTVGANKNTIKIIGEETENHAQAYFVYDSKKSGAMTISHLRFGKKPIRAPYLIEQADFVACHQWQFLNQFEVADYARPGATLLLNSPYDADTTWRRLPSKVQNIIRERGLKVHAIDAYRVARDAGMGGRTNTIMQVAFFALSGVLPKDDAIQRIKDAIQKTYGRKGPEIVEKNFAAVDAALANLFEVAVPSEDTESAPWAPGLPEEAPDFVKNITKMMMDYHGDQLPVSALPPDGVWPTGTTQWERRNIAQEIPVWDPEVCIQCNMCALVCPHATIRAKYVEEGEVGDAPETFQTAKFRSREHKEHRFIIQVAPEDCTGCGLCVTLCPAKNRKEPSRKAINMTPKDSVLEAEKANWAYFQSLPYPDRLELDDKVKSTQFMEPLFEFSGACAGCGETPYLKLLTQMFGDRLMIANATGCSSIYGGNLPTTPYTTNADGRGPTWANSLFEDNAEFGLGIRLAQEKRMDVALGLLGRLADRLDSELVEGLRQVPQLTEAEIVAQRKRVVELRAALKGIATPEAEVLHDLADNLVERSVWIVGGDGWAYDIGFGGLDHVIASGRNVNILVLDTEVYSNTGGQASKSTPMGAIAKFASAGKAIPKKDLGLLAMSYGNAYVAKVAMGAKDKQTVEAFRNAAAFPGPSLIIAYSHCIAHGYNLNYGMDQQKRAVQSGYWPLYHFDPRLAEAGQAPFKLDSAAPRIPLRDYMQNEARFRMLAIGDPDRAKMLEEAAQEQINQQRRHYEQMAEMTPLPATADIANHADGEDKG